MPIQAKVGWRAYVSPVTASYLLDSYSGAAAAYSLRKLRTTYTGSAIRVRRSSDNTELNIGFDASGNLDTTALLSFVGAGSGMVTLWYDQSLNVKDAVQTTASNQPQVVINGVLVTQNGMPSVYFNQDILFINRVFSTSNFSAFVLTSGSNGQTDTTVLAQHNGTPDGGRTVFISPNNELAPYDKLKTFFNNGTSYSIKSSTSVFNGSMSLINVSSDGAGNTYQFVNSSMVGSLTGTNWTPLNTYTTIGNYSNNATSTAYVGYINEIVLYTTNQLSNRSGIESNINAHYSIYSNVSSLLTSLYAVYNADSIGSSSLKTSLFAAYNGESNTNDSFGTNNGTAVGGLTYGTGKIGNAFNLNGTNSYVSLPNNSLNFTGDFSYSAWVYFRDVPTGERFIITATNGNAISTDFGVSFGILSGQLVLGVYANTDLSAWKSNVTLATSTWYHVTVTKTISNAPKFYINGVLQTTSLLAGTNPLNPIYTSGAYPNSLATIGAYRYNNGSSIYGYSNANIDAVNVWNKELTQSEITELYNSGNGSQYIGDNFYKPTPNDALNTYNGTAQGGLTYEVGKVGTAFKFNGTNAFINLGDVMDLGLSSWSYGMWFKSNVASAGTLFSKTIAAGLAGRFAAYIDSNRINFLFDPNYSNPLNIGTSNTIVTNTWYHLVCVFDRTSNIRLYLNGVLQSVTISYGLNDLSQFGAANTNYNTHCLFRIGAYTAADNINVASLFNGSIDAFNVWNRVLTESEITELYNSGNGKQYPY